MTEHLGEGQEVVTTGIDTVVRDTPKGDTAAADPRIRKLKPGPSLPAETVVADQRRRLHSAVIDIVDERGWRGVKVRPLVEAAGVSTASFYRQFANADECLASACKATIAAAFDIAASSGQKHPDDWSASLGAALAAFLDQIASGPRASRVALIDIFSAGPHARRTIPVTFARLESLLARSLDAAPRVPRHLLAGIAAGVLRVVRTTTLAGQTEELRDLAPLLTDWIAALVQPEMALLLAPPSDAARREPRPFPLAMTPPEESDSTGDRGCMLRAVRRLAAEGGYESLTVPRIRTEAGVSRHSFDRCFASTDDCFISSIEEVATGAAIRARAWSADEDSWTRRTCRELLAMCAQAARNHRLARLVFIDLLAPGQVGLLRREQLVSEAAIQLRSTVPSVCRPSLLQCEASVAAAWHIAQTDIASGRTKDLPTVAPLLSYVVLAPIVGSTDAGDTARTEVGWQ